MPIERVFYYDPECGINPVELHRVLERVPLAEWNTERLTITYSNQTYFSGTYDYKNGVVGFRFKTGDKRSPLIITGTSQRQMNRVASKLTKILKMGKLTKIDQGEFV